jgi:hypothetical protein
MKTKNIILLLCLISSISCSLLRGDNKKDGGSKLIVKHDANIIIEGKSEAIKGGESKSIEGIDLIKIEAKGKAPMIIFPTELKDKALEIDLPNLSSSQISEVQSQLINKELDVILPEVQKVQVMMIQQDYTNALSKIRDLKLKYPKVAFFSFLEGACYKILNRQAESLAAIREGLLIFPDSSEAKELYKQAGGEEKK